MSQGISPLPKDDGPAADPVKVISTKRLHTDTPSSPGYPNVYVRRKLETEHSKANPSQELKGNVKDETKEQDGQQSVQHDQVNKLEAISPILESGGLAPSQLASHIGKSESPEKTNAETVPSFEIPETVYEKNKPPITSVHEPSITSVHEPPITSAHERPIASGNEPPNVSRNETPNASGHGPPNVSGHEEPNASGHEPPNVSGHEEPNASNHQPPNASGHELPNASGHEPSNASSQQPPNASGHELPNASGHEPPNSSGTTVQGDNHRSSSQNQYWSERYNRLQTYLENCDCSTQEGYMRMLRSMSASDRSMHAIELEKRAIHLLVEEGKELQLMKALNVLGKVSPNGAPKQAPLQQRQYQK